MAFMKSTVILVTDVQYFEKSGYWARDDGGTG